MCLPCGSTEFSCAGKWQRQRPRPPESSEGADVTDHAGDVGTIERLHVSGNIFSNKFSSSQFVAVVHDVSLERRDDCGGGQSCSDGARFRD